MHRKVASFREYLKTLGNFEVISTDKFVETGDAFFLEATVRMALEKLVCTTRLFCAMERLPIISRERSR